MRRLASRASMSKKVRPGSCRREASMLRSHTRGFAAFARFRVPSVVTVLLMSSYVPTEASGNPLDAETRGNARKLANRSDAHPGREARRAEIFFTKTLGVKEGSSGLV